MTAEQIDAVVEKYGVPIRWLKWSTVLENDIEYWAFNPQTLKADTLGELLEQAVKTLPIEEKRS